MFNIIWEFIINLLESFLFAVICNAKFTGYSKFFRVFTF